MPSEVLLIGTERNPYALCGTYYVPSTAGPLHLPLVSAWLLILHSCPAMGAQKVGV